MVSLPFQIPFVNSQYGLQKEQWRDLSPSDIGTLHSFSRILNTDWLIRISDVPADL